MPFAGDQFGRLHRGNDRHQRHLRKIGGEGGEIEGEAGATDDHLGAGLASDAHHRIVVGDSDHAVGADDSVRGDGVGLGEFVAQSQRVGGKEVAAVKVAAY